VPKKQEGSAPRRQTDYLVLIDTPDGWIETGRFTAHTPIEACKDAAGRGEAASPGSYWAVPARSERNRLTVVRRQETVVEYGDYVGRDGKAYAAEVEAEASEAG
jgi:hypothetical protein